VKLTLDKIINVAAALIQISSEKMPVKLAYNIGRNLRLVEPEVKAYEKARIDLIKTKYGKKQKDDDQYEVPPKAIEAFMAEIEELQSVEIDLDLHTVNITEIKFDISPATLMGLECILIDNPPEEVQKTQRNSSKKKEKK